MSEQYVFISYRRIDAVAAARVTLRRLQSWLGGQAVFMDTESVRIGNRWREAIHQALQRSTILIAVIGPHWLTVTDSYGKRRIDRDDDWVRLEVETALAQGKEVIPLLVGDTKRLEKEGLPASLQALEGCKSLRLTDESWERNLNDLSGRLRELGLRISDPKVPFPRPTVTLPSLDEMRLSGIPQELPGWSVTTSEIPGLEPNMRTELHRVFDFRDFMEAIGFMQEASRFINDGEHHPRWENLWRSVSVWLATWDTGYTPSELDIKMARQLDALYDAHQARTR